MTRNSINILRRTLLAQGSLFTFERCGLNDFGEPNGIFTAVKQLRGIFHQQNHTVPLERSDGATVEKRSLSAIICIYSDTDELKGGDRVMVGNQKFSVTAVTDVENAESIAEICLEAVNDGGD